MRHVLLIICAACLTTSCDKSSGQFTTSFSSSYTLTGTVRLSDGRVANGARVERFDGNNGFRLPPGIVTDANGVYALPGLVGVVNLQAWRPGYYPDFEWSLLRSGQVDFVLERGEDIHVGDTLAGVLLPRVDRACDMEYPEESVCRVFSFVPDTSRTIELAATWPDNVPLVLMVSTLQTDVETPRPARGRTVLTTAVVAGAQYEIRIRCFGVCSPYELTLR